MSSYALIALQYTTTQLKFPPPTTTTTTPTEVCLDGLQRAMYKIMYVKNGFTTVCGDAEHWLGAIFFIDFKALKINFNINIYKIKNN